MSLHAESSPEAVERLHAQQRNSTISSIIIAGLTVTLVALVLAWRLLPAVVMDVIPEATYILPRDTTVDTNPPKVRLPQHKPASSSVSMARVLVSQSISSLSIPTLDVEITAPSVEFGNADGFGDGWPGAGDPDGQFATIPPGLQKRCSKMDRLARLEETGGSPACDDAVTKALDWLKSHQNTDGSWTGSNQSAMTGLALLAYLGHCETPTSRDYGDTVLRAIGYLVDLGMKNGGKLTTNAAEKHWPYEHAIATYALAEATTFSRKSAHNLPELYEITQKAGQLIIDNQHTKSGGWDYAYDTYGPRGGDMSITAWQVQALKACRHTGLEFRGLERSAAKALSYIQHLESKDGGFAYAKANETPHADGYRTMTGGAVLCLQMWDKGSSASARHGAKYIAKNTRFAYDTEYSDLYGHYYESQAMLNRGGGEWREYNALLRDQLLNHQNPDGSWAAPGGGKSIRAVAPQYTANAHYRTCLNTLMLEVYYRFLPGTSAH